MSVRPADVLRRLGANLTGGIRRGVAAAMLSRATAGLAGERVLFALPGSRGALRTALEKLILPELGHLVGEGTKRGRR